MNEHTEPSRLDELEARQAFQDDTIASLNQALIEQEKRLTRLEKMLDLIIERVRQSEPDAAFSSEEPPPPHY